MSRKGPPPFTWGRARLTAPFYSANPPASPRVGDLSICWDGSATGGIALVLYNGIHWEVFSSTGLLPIVKAEAMAIVDAVLRFMTFGRFAADALVAPDVTSRAHDSARTIADALVAPDATARAHDSARAVADALVAPDATSQTTTFARSASDAPTATDGALSEADSKRAPSDVAVMSDHVFTSKNEILDIAVSDTAAAVDQAAAVLE